MAEEQPTTEPVQVEEPTTEDRPVIPAITGLIVVVILILLTSFWPTYRRNVLERGAKSTLRELGSAQFAYQGTNNDKHYGTFEILQENLLIPKDKTPETLIKGYALTWNLANQKILFAQYKTIGFSRFTITAYPSVNFPPDLHTFAINERQRVLVYHPENGNLPDSVSTWDKVD